MLERDGFPAEVHNTNWQALSRLKQDSGVPEAMTSCHRAMINGSVIEGHVPPADVRRLLEDSPDAIGLAVPCMTWGSPGMGPESERDAYTVFLIGRDGQVTPFAHYDSA